MPSTYLKKFLNFAPAMCLAGSLVYGFANYLSGKYYLPGCSFAEMRPQVAIPMSLGIVFGPMVGFITGMLGDMLGYFIGGKGLFYAPVWSLANGFMGLTPGLLRHWEGRRIVSILAFAKLLVLLLAASSLPFTLPIALEINQGNLSCYDALYKLFFPIFITDSLWALMLVPAFLLVAGILQSRIEIRTILSIHYLVLFTILITWICSIMITMSTEIRIKELYMLGAITLLVLIIGLAVSALLAKRMSSPLVTLTRVAEKVRAGDYSNAPLLRYLFKRQDEIGMLAHVFSDMIQAVESRETALKREVKELRIEIDHKKQQAELKKITGTDYFKNLKQKAGDLRRKAANIEDDKA